VLVEDVTYVSGRRSNGDREPAQTSPDTSFEWLGFVEPSEDELIPHASRLGIDPLAIEDALSSSQRAKIDRFATHTCILIKTITYDDSRRRIDVGDATLIFSESFILSVRHGRILPLRDVRQHLEQSPDRLAVGPGAVVHEYLDRVVDQYMVVVDDLQRDLMEIEDAAFGDSAALPTGRAYLVKREILECRRAVIPLIDALHVVLQGDVPGIAGSLRNQFKDVYDHLRKVVDDVERLNELVDAALAACLNLAQVQQNADMRRISAWVGLAAVPTMVAGIYGMNFSYMPELQVRWAYFTVMGGTALFSLFLFVYFRRRKWL
jgi:magnesium transporter